MTLQTGSPVVVPRTSVGTAQSAVSWAAIFAGAAAAAALSLVLVVLGFGLGLSSVSPWSGLGVTTEAVGIGTVIWISFSQFAASGVGGYLAGRLRIKWSTLHTDEVYFRDTAHGFMAWAVASLATAAFLGSALSGVLDTGAKAGATLAGGAATAATAAAGTMASKANDNGGLGYFTDALYRKDAAHASAPGTPDTSHAEATRIFATDLANGQLNDDDRQYLANAVAQETGLTPADATTRVNDTFNKAKAAADNAANTAKQAADAARKAAAHAALWMFVSLMIGAFIASFAATLGGRRRDLHE